VWDYKIWLKGRKDPITVQLADSHMLSDWAAWQQGDTTKRVSLSISEKYGAVANFALVEFMSACEHVPPEFPVVSNQRPSIRDRARPLFGNR